MTTERELPRKSLDGREKDVDLLDKLSWTVQPPLGLIKGTYYCEEAFFNLDPRFPFQPGFRTMLEVVKDNDKIVHVEYNEWATPTCYIRTFQDANKRRSAYCFYQAGKERTAQTLAVLNNGICAVEQQMLEQNRLTGEFDLVCGASNSVKKMMLPLAAKIEAMTRYPNDKRYYGCAEKMDSGVTPWLQVVVCGDDIVRCFYDEVFADTPEEITKEEHKKYYRQSKYHCRDYETEYYDGINALFDILQQRVIATQNLLDLSGLPWIADTARTRRIPEWDNYLRLAARIQAEMKKDGILK